MVSFRKVFVKSKILFRIRIRIRIMSLLWLLLWNFFGSANSFESYRVHIKSPRTYIQTDRQTEGNFFRSFCLLRHTKHEHSSKGENFFFLQLCDYNIFSFYILRMWWESKKLNASNLSFQKINFATLQTIKIKNTLSII